MQSRAEDDRLRGEFSRHRDLMMLRWMGEQYAARLDHLAALTKRSPQTTQAIVARLRTAGYVQTRHILVGEPTWVVPTRAGLGACGSPYSEFFPRSISLARVAATNEVRLNMHTKVPDAQWVPRRQLLRESTTGTNVPDALGIWEGRKAAFVVEVAMRRLPILRAKLEKLYQPGFELVLFYCAPGPYGKLRDLQKTGHWPKLRVRELEKLGGEPA